MKVEVGDWVKLRGMKRIYGEVLTAGPKGWRTVTVSRAEIISIEQMGGRIVLKFRDQ